MNHDFRVLISFDPDVAKWYVSYTELPGLILEDADPGSLLTRMRDAAADLLKARAGDYGADLNIGNDDKVRIVPIYQPIEVWRSANGGGQRRKDGGGGGSATARKYRPVDLASATYQALHR